nr:MAG TPA: hypothetical protein [Caudoviricetes sp.]
MLMTKYKVQELVDGIEISLDDLEKYSGVKLDDDSAILVSSAIEILKERIIDELGGGHDESRQSLLHRTSSGRQAA